VISLRSPTSFHRLDNPPGLSVRYEAVMTLNLFLRHRFCAGNLWRVLCELSNTRSNRKRTSVTTAR